MFAGGANNHPEHIKEMSQEALRIMRDRYLHAADLTPKVYYRITNNWLELTVRLHEHGIRDKDASPDILKAFRCSRY